jgi:hypothetical protein
VQDESSRPELVCQVHFSSRRTTRSSQPVPGRSSLGRPVLESGTTGPRAWGDLSSSLGQPVIVAPSAVKIGAAALLEASQLPIGRAAGLSTPARRALPEDAFSPRAFHGRNPQSGTPAVQRASHVTPQRLTSRANHARARGLQVLTCPPASPVDVPLIQRIDRPIQKPAPRELPRNSDQSDLRTTHPAVGARGSERSSAVIGGSVLPREARGRAATRIAPGICVSAGTDCRQSTELEPRH